MSGQNEVHLRARASLADGSPVLEWVVAGQTIISVNRMGIDVPNRQLRGPGPIALMYAALEVFEKGEKINWAINEFFMKQAMRVTNEKLDALIRALDAPDKRNGVDDS